MNYSKVTLDFTYMKEALAYFQPILYIHIKYYYNSCFLLFNECLFSEPEWTSGELMS